MSRRIGLLLVVAGLAALAVTGIALGKTRGSAPPKVGTGLDRNAQIELRLGAGVTYKILSTANQCADDLNFPSGTTKSAVEQTSVGFNPSNEIDDGCITRASWSDYIVYISGPYSGQIEFEFTDGTNGGPYHVNCLRHESEFGVWCHKTGQTSLIIGKLN